MPHASFDHVFGRTEETKSFIALGIHQGEETTYIYDLNVSIFCHPSVTVCLTLTLQRTVHQSGKLNGHHSQRFLLIRGSFWDPTAALKSSFSGLDLP